MVFALKRAGLLDMKASQSKFACEFFNNILPDRHGVVAQHHVDIVHKALGYATSDECIRVLVSLVFAITKDALGNGSTKLDNDFYQLIADVSQEIAFGFGIMKKELFEMWKQFRDAAATSRVATLSSLFAASTFGAMLWKSFFP
jgi:hypothetical protein